MNPSNVSEKLECMKFQSPHQDAELPLSVKTIGTIIFMRGRIVWKSRRVIIALIRHFPAQAESSGE